MNARELLDWIKGRKDDYPLQLNMTHAEWEIVCESLFLYVTAESNSGSTPETDAEAGEAVFTESGCAAEVVNADFASSLEQQRDNFAAEVLRLREDAERMDWIEHEGMMVLDDLCDDSLREGKHTTIRAVIDAARGKP